jgi:hypothetical protein
MTDRVPLEPTERQILAARDVLREEFVLGLVPIRDFIRSPTDPPPGPERDAALAAFHAEEAASGERVRAVIRRALMAAWLASDD